MKKILMASLLISSMSSFAVSIDYSKCEETTKKIFKQSKNPNIFSSPVFTIEANGRLMEAKNTVIKSYSEDDQTYTFRYNDKVRPKKGDKEFSYKVEKDSEGRISKIKQLGCEECEQNVVFSYVKNDCMPKQVTTYSEAGDEIILADVEACKNIVKLSDDSRKRMKKTKSCLADLESFELSLMGVLKRYEGELKVVDGTSQEDSPFVSSLSKTKSALGQMQRLTLLKHELSEHEEIYGEHFNKLVATCHNTYGIKTLRLSTDFEEDENGVLGLKTFAPKPEKEKKIRGKKVKALK